MNYRHSGFGVIDKILLKEKQLKGLGGRGGPEGLEISPDKRDLLSECHGILIPAVPLRQQGEVFQKHPVDEDVTATHLG